MRKVAILGSTGSIGLSALEVCAAAPDRFEVVALSAHRSAPVLAAQVARWRPAHVAVVDAGAQVELSGLVGSQNGGGLRPRVYAGVGGLLELIANCGADVFLLGIAGAACLPASFAAARQGAVLGLANKETVVMAGPLFMEEVRKCGSTLVPVDSEHSAIFQALGNSRREEVRKLHLTSSGGPFRTTAKEKFPALTIEEALRHPRWKMGEKITIDSATMMNKALEIVEARWLFDAPAEDINVVVHPQAIVHSLVEFVDGSMLAQLGVPDMKVPIRYALGYPDRVPAVAPGLALSEFAQLTFEAPDALKFPSLGLGFAAARAGGTMGAVLNGANEEAVRLFLSGRIRFDEITRSVGEVMQRHALVSAPTLEEIEVADLWARAEVSRLHPEFAPT